MEFVKIKENYKTVNINPSAILQNLDLEYLLKFHANNLSPNIEVMWHYMATADNEVVTKVTASNIYYINANIKDEQLSMLIMESFDELATFCKNRNEVATLQQPVLTDDIAESALLQLKSVFRDKK